jgi:FMN phosphatase YigB (HAD superfamily)
MSTPVAAVTVDLDDTLYPQADWLAGAWAAVADEGGRLGLDRAALHEALLRTCAEGSDRGGIVDRAVSGIGGWLTVVPALVAAFSAHRPVRLTPYPGVAAALAVLAAEVPVVCVTDGLPDVQHAKVDALGLGHLLTAVVVSDELGGRHLRKPHPAPFLRALGLVGVAPGLAVHVGDRSEKDVAGARAVGMRCIRVRTGEYAGLPDPEDLLPWRSTARFPEAAEILLPLLSREQDALPARL